MKEQHPVHAAFDGHDFQSTGVSFDDYSRMHVHLHKMHRGRRLAAPAWIYNDDQLCNVLARAMEERALTFRQIQKGTNIERLARAQAQLQRWRPQLVGRVDKLCRLFLDVKDESPDAADKLRIQVENLDTQLRTLPDMPKILTAVIYYYWRAGLDSVQIGQQLGLKPPHIRQLLKRLLDSAKVLGFAPPDVIVPRYIKHVGGKRIATYPRRARPVELAGPSQDVVRLFKEGKFTVDIARELKLGADGCEIVNLILIQAGLR